MKTHDELTTDIDVNHLPESEPEEVGSRHRVVSMVEGMVQPGLVLRALIRENPAGFNPQQFQKLWIKCAGTLNPETKEGRFVGQMMNEIYDGIAKSNQIDFSAKPLPPLPPITDRSPRAMLVRFTEALIGATEPLLEYVRANPATFAVAEFLALHHRVEVAYNAYVETIDGLLGDLLTQ